MPCESQPEWCQTLQGSYGREWNALSAGCLSVCPHHLEHLPQTLGAQAWVKCSIKVVPPFQPTAQIFADETAATPRRPLPGAGLGVETMLQADPSQCCVCIRPLPSTAQTSVDPGAVTEGRYEFRENSDETVHAVPFQCSVIVLPALVSGFFSSPTAQMSVADTAAIPRREMVPPFAFIDGAETFAHLVPSQCSMMSVMLGLVWTATAQTLFADRAVTPNSSFTSGLETTDQLAPSQCSISERRGLKVPPSPARPTAQTSLPATPDMEWRSFSWLSGLGLGTILQLMPSQCSIRVNDGKYEGFS